MKYLILILLLTGCTTIEVVQIDKKYAIKKGDKILEQSWDNQKQAEIMCSLINRRRIK